MGSAGVEQGQCWCGMGMMPVWNRVCCSISCHCPFQATAATPDAIQEVEGQSSPPRGVATPTDD